MFSVCGTNWRLFKLKQHTFHMCCIPVLKQRFCLQLIFHNPFSKDQKDHRNFVHALTVVLVVLSLLLYWTYFACSKPFVAFCIYYKMKFVIQQPETLIYGYWVLSDAPRQWYWKVKCWERRQIYLCYSKWEMKKCGNLLNSGIYRDTQFCRVIT